VRREHIVQNGGDDPHRIRRKELAHKSKNVAEQIRKRNQADYCGEEDEAGKNGEHEIIRESRRYLEDVMPHHILVRAPQGAFNASEIHCPKNRPFQKPLKIPRTP
jgi:hypothetical protein